MVSVNIKISRPDPELQTRMAWFLSQPGIDWTIINEPSSNLNNPLLNITRQGIILEYSNQKLSFHPSMALLRLINIIRGIPDRFLNATGLQPGKSILDATLGLATDALVASVVVGSNGKVTGVEKSPLLSALVRDGLNSLSKSSVPDLSNQDKKEAWRQLVSGSSRIEVNIADHLEYFRDLPDNSYDIIYFDPMFRRTREASSSIRPLHGLSKSDALTKEAIKEAVRVAKERVVLKERKGSKEFERLGFEVTPDGKYSEIDFGIIKI